MSDATISNLNPTASPAATSPSSSTSASPLSPFISSHSTTSSEATTADSEGGMHAPRDPACRSAEVLKRVDPPRGGQDDMVSGSEAGADGGVDVNDTTPLAELDHRFAHLYSFVLPPSALPVPLSKPLALANGPTRTKADATPASSVTSSMLSSLPSSPAYSLLADAAPADGLLPPANFSMVAPGVYRSAFPGPANFAYLDTLGLKTVCVLVQEPYPPANEQWRAAHGIRLLQFGIPGHKEAPMPPAVIEQALLAVLDKRNHPMLIHCNKGKHRTGCVVGCLRRLQRWTTEKSIEEYCKHSHPKSRAADQAFVTAFALEQVQRAIDGPAKAWLPEWFDDPVEQDAVVEEVVGCLEQGKARDEADAS